MRLTTALLLLSLSLAVGTAGCDDDDDGTPPMTTGAPDAGSAPTPDGGAGGAPGSDAGSTAPLVLTEWVHDLVSKHTNQTSDPDTVDDKEGRLQISEDPEAFTPILQQQ